MELDVSMFEEFQSTLGEITEECRVSPDTVCIHEKCSMWEMCKIDDNNKP
jgi:hypothetical protein